MPQNYVLAQKLGLSFGRWEFWPIEEHHFILDAELKIHNKCLAHAYIF